MLVGVLHCVLRFFENREVAEGTLEIYMGSKGIPAIFVVAVFS